MARFKVTRWNDEELLGRTETVLNDYAKTVDPEFRAQFERVVYRWKGPQGVTRRKNGEVVTEPRNIKDTGALQESQRWALESANTLVFAWGGGFVTYAGAVFFGVPFRGANGPGRDWIAPVLRRVPFREFFVERWGKAGR